MPALAAGFLLLVVSTYIQNTNQVWKAGASSLPNLCLLSGTYIAVYYTLPPPLPPLHRSIAPPPRAFRFALQWTLKGTVHRNGSG
jgi:hypothetical protein